MFDFYYLLVYIFGLNFLLRRIILINLTCNIDFKKYLITMLD